MCANAAEGIFWSEDPIFIHRHRIAIDSNRQSRL
jgi:hypothetical protein